MVAAINIQKNVYFKLVHASNANFTNSRSYIKNNDNDINKKDKYFVYVMQFFFSHFEMKNISFIYHLNKINK